MTKEHDTKTNAMRLLDAAGLPYRTRFFETDGAVSGVQVAAMLGLDPDAVFKTLVTQGKSGEHYVFMIPVACELDLKKAARACGEKAVSMIRSRELLPLTGYVHGGCSPLGMKKPFPTFADESCQLYDELTFSGGRIGCQITMAPDDLLSAVGARTADLIVV